MCDRFIDEAEIETLSPLEVSALMSEDLEDLCRLCMGNEKTQGLDMVAISDKYPESNIFISSLFFDVLQINVDDADSSSLPPKACMECLRKLYSYGDFRQQTLCVDAKLRQIVHRKQKISEAQALYGPVFSDLDASFSSSTAPIFFEGADESRSDICAPALPPPYKDVGKLTQANSSLNVHKVEDSWDDKSVTEDPELNSYETGLINSTKFISNTIQKFNAVCSEKESDTYGNFSFGEKTTDPTDTITTVVDIISETCFNNPSQSVSEEIDIMCPDIIAEIVVSDPSAPEEDSNAADFVPDRLDVYEVLSPEDSTNSSEIVSTDNIKKCNSSRLPVPEVFAIAGQAERQLCFRCPLCKRVFQSDIQFRKHASLHVKAKGCVCKYCGKWFQTSNALLRHERIHSGEKPFVCILCDRCFSQKEILQRHILTHTDKPFPCKHCDKRYAQKSGLESHLKHHHKPTPEISQYPCLLCNKAFCHPSGLSRHMLTHSGKQYVCKFCERNFSDSSALRRHSKNKHGAVP